MAQQNYLLLSLRIISVALLALLLAELGQIYNPEIYRIIDVFQIIGILRDMISFVFYILLYFIYVGIFTVIRFVVVLLSGTTFYDTAGQNLFYNLIGRWFKFTWVNTEVTSTSPDIDLAILGLKNLWADATQDIYMVGLQILIIVLFYQALRGAITSDPGASVKVILYLNAIIIIPLFIEQIVVILEYFGVSAAILPVWFQEIINHNLLLEGIYLDVADLSIWEYLQTPIFLVAMLEFVYLEFVFQLSYVDKVTRPSIEREQRLTRQIEVMHSEAQKAIARIKAIEEHKRELQMEARTNMSDEERERAKQEKERMSLTSLMSESGAQVGFSYVAELIRKKKEEKKEAKMMNAMRDTRKIANYLDKLFKQDPEARAALTASSAAPRSSRLLLSSIVNTLVRIVLITAMAWACVHPYQFFELIRAPPAILNSVELQTYEGTWSILIPLVLIIPMISYIIKITKHAKLEELLRLEEIRRAGLTEEEYDALLAEREQETVAEKVELARDQDAVAADQAKKAQMQP